MGNYADKLRTLTAKHKRGFTVSLKTHVNNADKYEEPTKGMSVDDIAKAYHHLKIQYEAKNKV